ncbi:hypothetical protein [Coxiella burnetii]|uniref:hypothetical protein n=1 Tax=Coxiella burnetii TaxID=777 RepID=UPI000163A200|nr:hypothetical protein [Coxiella burnetii]ATN85470.1 hypothetical protein AYO29_02635 [Coxiella burnetii str. Schperling]EDR36377.1 hypothetical protein COXBURSA334_0902 [Coxiella burnetii Q321]
MRLLKSLQSKLLIFYLLSIASYGMNAIASDIKLKLDCVRLDSPFYGYEAFVKPGTVLSQGDNIACVIRSKVPPRVPLIFTINHHAKIDTGNKHEFTQPGTGGSADKLLILLCGNYASQEGWKQEEGNTFKCLKE